MIIIKTMICLSTQFGHPGDGYGGRTPTLLHDRPVEEDDLGIAHRTWPLGSWVLVKNMRTGLTAPARVIDRGPYGKVDEEGNWFNSRRKRNRGRDGTYRGCADLTPKLAELLEHNGRDRVKLTLVDLDL